MFLALLEAASFREAGEALGVNASTVGRRLDALEASLGVRLFERTRGGVAPTAAAERLAPAALHFARAASAFSHATSAIETEPVGRVVISAPTGIANRVLVPVLPALVARFPRLQVVVDTNNAFADLDRKEADLALRAATAGAGLRGGQNLVARRLMGPSPVVPVTSPAYAEELGQLDDLARARWVTFGERTAGFGWARRVLDHVPPDRIVLRSDEASTVFRAAEAGLGATFVTRIFADERLVEVPLGPGLRSDDASDEEELWLVGHRALREVPRVAAVWNLLVERLAD